MTSKHLDEAREVLRARKANLRCTEVISILESLGFVVSSGKAPGHRLFTHPGLKDFFSSSFNCDHGKNPQIKPAYVTNILKVLATHETALSAHLDGVKK